MPTKMTIDDVNPKLLRANGWNTNVMSPDNEAKLRESMARLGLFKPILVRTLASGELEVLGGEHRWQIALKDGATTVPVVNLGVLSDEKAKEISLVDNGRYGHDDTLKLAELLGSLGDVDELSSFLPMDEQEMRSIFSAKEIALDDLEMSDEDDKPAMPPASKVQQFQILRFKVPVADAHLVTDRVEAVMKAQKFDKDDSLTNAGMALIHICTNP